MLSVSLTVHDRSRLFWSSLAMVVHQASFASSVWNNLSTLNSRCWLALSFGRGVGP